MHTQVHTNTHTFSWEIEAQLKCQLLSEAFMSLAELIISLTQHPYYFVYTPSIALNALNFNSIYTAVSPTIL